MTQTTQAPKISLPATGRYLGVEEAAKVNFEKMSPWEKKMVQKEFEQLYGTDKNTRTKKQWENLVTKYGVRNVMKMESLTKAYIKEKLRYGRLV